MDTGYIDLSTLPLFLTAVFVICIAPGPDMAYMIGTGVAGGRPAATRAALGVTLGVATYAVVVASGLGLLVARHPGALIALQVFGAVYLVWLGYDTFKDARRPQIELATEQVPRSWFRRGLVVNLTNPKCMLFFLAFLPQFLLRGAARLMASWCEQATIHQRIRQHRTKRPVRTKINLPRR